MEDMYSGATKRVSNSKFVEFEPGKKVRIRVLTHPRVTAKQFQAGAEVKTQFAWAVWNYELERLQLLQKGPGFFKRIGAIVQAYGAQVMPMQADLEITANGAGLQTTYDIIPVPVAGTAPTVATEDLKELAADLPGSISLADFSQGVNPEVQGPGSNQPVQTASVAPSGDTVVEDVHPGQPINLDDIPF